MKHLLLTLLWVGYFFVSPAQTDSLSYYLRQGEDAASRGQTLVAYNSYRSAIAQDSRNLTALRGMANAANELRYYAIARETYKKILVENYNDTASIRNLMVLHFNTHQWPEAVDMAKRAKALGLGDHQNWIIAKSYFEMGEYRSTLEYLDKAFKEDSSLAEMHYVMARCQLEMNNYVKAAAYYNSALQRDPSKAQWMFELGMTNLAVPDPAASVKWLEAALAKGYPLSSEMKDNMVTAYTSAGMYDKAVGMVKELLKESPTDIDRQFLLGECQLHAKQYVDAIKTYNGILQQDPKNARSLYMSGVATIQSGEKAKGEALCEKAITMDSRLAKMRQKYFNQVD
ncbi:MAG: tetratricopeptide repeat protein [Bacteroidetes bacterium]|nr:tetratricopeptide repeat protein [Bacteroidota bacterium]